MDCGTKIIKFIIFAVNLIFVIGGILLIAVGAMTQIGTGHYTNFVEGNIDDVRALPILLMIVGAIVFVIAFLGCCGVIRQSNCMIMAYATIIGFILVVEIAIAITVWKQADEIKGKLTSGFNESLQQYGSNDAKTNAWNAVQSQLHCCGITTYKDWETTNSISEDKIPKSCCKNLTEPTCPKEALVKTDMIYTEGCLDKALDNMGFKWIIIAAGVFTVVLLVAVIFACYLAAQFRSESSS